MSLCYYSIQLTSCYSNDRITTIIVSYLHVVRCPFFVILYLMFIDVGIWKICIFCDILVLYKIEYLNSSNFDKASTNKPIENSSKKSKKRIVEFTH